MTSPDKATEALLELGSSTERWTHAELLNRVLRIAQTLTEADAVVILTTPKGREERLALHAGSTVLAALQAPPDGSAVLRSLVESRAPILIPDLSEDGRYLATDACPGVEAGPVMFLPLRQRNLVPSYLAIYRRRGRARFVMQDVRSMLLLAAWLSAETENLQLLSRRQRLTLTDDLVDVFHFRFLKSALQRETLRARRFDRELSVVKIAIDAAGRSTEAVRLARFTEVAQALSRLVRSFDILARCGPEQLMLLLPETGRDGALEVAERARSVVERLSFSPGESGVVTVSLGVATFPLDAGDAKGLLFTADRALRTATKQGGNCVVTAARRAA